MYSGHNTPCGRTRIVVGLGDEDVTDSAISSPLICGPDRYLISAPIDLEGKPARVALNVDGMGAYNC